MQVYITKYALNTGVYCQDVEPQPDTAGWVMASDGADYTEYFCVPDYQETFAEALKRANSMRDDKILSLKLDLARKAESVGRQIRDLDGMRFDLQDWGAGK